MYRFANSSTQNLIEVNGAVTFGGIIVRDDDETFRGLSISYLGKSFRCQIQTRLLDSPPIKLERVFVKAQLKRLGATEEWEVLGMVQIPFEDFSKTIDLPYWECTAEESVELFPTMNHCFSIPGLQGFVNRVFERPEFARAFMTAQFYELGSDQPTNIFAEAARAVIAIENNPFLSHQQKEIARVAALLHRSGRQWSGGGNSDTVAPQALSMNRHAIGWLSRSYPKLLQKLADIWRRLNDPAAKTFSDLPEEVYVAVWMALGMRVKHRDALDLLMD
jgi:hypothetical protein